MTKKYICKIESHFKESIVVKQLCLSHGVQCIVNMSDEIVNAIQNGNKVMFCGNGGSAADAQHLVAEMLVRLKPANNRGGMAAITLAQDTSTITAFANDFDYDDLYERMVSTLGKEGDCLVGISTSGNSENVVRAMKVARQMGINVFGFLGAGGGRMLEFCDEAFIVPSKDTGRIQESHITAGHALIDCVEDNLLHIGYLQIEE